MYVPSELSDGESSNEEPALKSVSGEIKLLSEVCFVHSLLSSIDFFKKREKTVINSQKYNYFSGCKNITYFYKYCKIKM